jgi:hypothetical protein
MLVALDALVHALAAVLNHAIRLWLQNEKAIDSPAELHD